MYFEAAQTLISGPSLHAMPKRQHTQWNCTWTRGEVAGFDRAAFAIATAIRRCRVGARS